jgi:Na+-transporting NADH:ubiquinone oxidoreductase subunit NqrD
MRTVYIILMFALAFLALYEQSKAQPNTLIMIAAMAAFVIGLMRLMAKVPSKGERTNEDENGNGGI